MGSLQARSDMSWRHVAVNHRGPPLGHDLPIVAASPLRATCAVDERENAEAEVSRKCAFCATSVKSIGPCVVITRVSSRLCSTISGILTLFIVTIPPSPVVPCSIPASSITEGSSQTLPPVGTEATGVGTAPGVYLREDPICGTQLENQSELRAPSADKAALYLDAALAARSATDEDEARCSHLLFTLNVYQYRIEKTNRAGLPGETIIAVTRHCGLTLTGARISGTPADLVMSFCRPVMAAVRAHNCHGYKGRDVTR
ncbi:hypothetical protein ACOMHN_023155 [Nucella lapillus]